MKITIEIDEEAAACVWANATWEGRYPKSLATILQDMATVEAREYARVDGSPQRTIQRAVEAFRKAGIQVES